MQVKWLKTALRNLEQAYTFIAKEDPQAAVQTLLKIQQGVLRLADFPEMGKVGRVEETRELVISSSPYFVVYRVKHNTVQILRILHSSRKYPSI